MTYSLISFLVFQVVVTSHSYTHLYTHACYFSMFLPHCNFLHFTIRIVLVHLLFTTIPVHLESSIHVHYIMLFKQSPPLAMAIVLDQKHGISHEGSSKIEFPVVQIASAIGWDSGTAKQHLKTLEWTKGKIVTKLEFQMTITCFEYNEVPYQRLSTCRTMCWLLELASWR